MPDEGTAFPGAVFSTGACKMVLFDELSGMESLEETAVQEEKPRFSLKRLMFWAGMACLLQFLVFGLVGVIRGYSVQSLAPIWVALVGVVLLMPFDARSRWAGFLSSLCLLVFALVGIGQGKNHKEGEKLYEAGKFEEAMVEFRQEIDTWYLRLKFNYHEGQSLFRIAECQSQLGRFDEALKSYREIETNLRGYQQDRARKTGNTMETKLAEIEEFKKALAEATGDEARAMIHFDLALAYRVLVCNAKAVEHYEAIQALDAPAPLRESAKKYADKLGQGVNPFPN